MIPGPVIPAESTATANCQFKFGIKNQTKGASPDSEDSDGSDSDSDDGYTLLQLYEKQSHEAQAKFLNFRNLYDGDDRMGAITEQTQADYNKRREFWLEHGVKLTM